MSPWSLIWEGTGWGVVGLIAFFVLVRGFNGANAIGQMIGRWMAYRRTRNVPPAKGQVWRGNGSYYEVTSIVPIGTPRLHPAGAVHEEELVVWKAGNTSSADNLDEWKKRVKYRRLHLEVR